jgi:hypothetical protein
MKGAGQDSGVVEAKNLDTVLLSLKDTARIGTMHKNGGIL